MSNKKYGTAVFIGRFQPLHNAHYNIIQKALQIADRVVIVIGSSNTPRSIKNPFLAHERIEMIAQALEWNFLGDGIAFEEVRDRLYDNQAWAVEVQRKVRYYEQNTEKPTVLVGHEKDASSFYLAMFPQWDKYFVDSVDTLSSTDIRDLYLSGKSMNLISGAVPTPVKHWLEQFQETKEYAELVGEYDFIQTYKSQFKGLAYPPIFVTADAVVVQSGHILLVKRRAMPGKGLYALPGGFVNATSDASVVDAAIRELKEETGIKVPEKVLYGSIQDSMVFDAVGRSSRGRTITHAFKIVLPDGDLPKVKGQDDAEKAFWLPLSKVDPRQMFEDHWDILSRLVGGLTE